MSKSVSGDKYGKLTLISFDRVKKRWLCKCDCGGETYASVTDMKNGRHLACKCSLYGDRLNRRLPNQKGIKNKLYNRYIYGAKKRNIIFKLTFDEVIDITSKNCFYCGVEPNTKLVMGNQIYTHNGIDRIDNSQGYTLDNVVTCCSLCNYSKKENTLAEWKIWIKRVYENLYNKED